MRPFAVCSLLLLALACWLLRCRGNTLTAFRTSVCGTASDIHWQAMCAELTPASLSPLNLAQRQHLSELQQEFLSDPLNLANLIKDSGKYECATPDEQSNDDDGDDDESMDTMSVSEFLHRPSHEASLLWNQYLAVNPATAATDGNLHNLRAMQRHRDAAARAFVVPMVITSGVAAVGTWMTDPYALVPSRLSAASIVDGVPRPVGNIAPTVASANKHRGMWYQQQRILSPADVLNWVALNPRERNFIRYCANWLNAPLPLAASLAQQGAVAKNPAGLLPPRWMNTVTTQDAATFEPHWFATLHATVRVFLRRLSRQVNSYDETVLVQQLRYFQGALHEPRCDLSAAGVVFANYVPAAGPVYVPSAQFTAMSLNDFRAFRFYQEWEEAYAVNTNLVVPAALVVAPAPIPALAPRPLTDDRFILDMLLTYHNNALWLPWLINPANQPDVYIIDGFVYQTEPAVLGYRLRAMHGMLLVNHLQGGHPPINMFVKATPTAVTPVTRWGQANDQAGHVRGNMMGGRLDPLNFLPQGQVLNEGGYRHAEYIIRNLLTQCPALVAEYSVQCAYTNAYSQLRPSQIRQTVHIDSTVPPAAACAAFGVTIVGAGVRVQVFDIALPNWPL